METIGYRLKNGIFVPDSIRLSNKGYGDAGGSWRKKSMKGFTAESGTPQEDIDAHNYTLRQRGRMLYMAAPVATSAIKTSRTNVVGCGLKLKSRINRAVLRMSPEEAAIWQKRAELEFSLWASNKRMCDATGVNDFYGLQQLVYISWLVSGDAFAVFKQSPVNVMSPYGLRLLILEADRVSTPSHVGYVGSYYSLLGTTGKAENGNIIYDGVEIDSSGAIAAYYIRSSDPYACTWQRVEAYGEETGLPNILQIMESERPEQYRGVTYLAQIIEPLLQTRRYTESELTAAVVQSFFAAFVTSDSEIDNVPGGPFNETTPQDQVSRDPNEYEMGAGTINYLRPNEDVKFSQPSHPNTGFETFMRAMAVQMGAALEEPADLLLKEFNSSYSASRAAMLEAWKGFKMRREWFTNDFCHPTYECWMAEAVSRGRISAPGFFSDPIMRAAWLGSEWIGPSQGQLDPVKEITAKLLAIENAIETHEQATVELNGGSWDANVEQLTRENKLLAGAGLREKSSSSTPVTDIVIGEIKNMVRETMKEDEKSDAK